MVSNAFDEIAAEWNAYRRVPSSSLPFFLKFLKKDSIALDLGCGNGRNLVEIAQRCLFAYGIDLSQKMLAFAEKNIRDRRLDKKVKLVVADACSVPLPDEAADALFCMAVAHHIETKEGRKRLFKEIFRLLRLGGKAFISVWNKYQKRFENIGDDARIKWRMKNGKVVERFYHFFEDSELKELADSTGFSIKELFYEKDGKRFPREKAENLCMIVEKSR
ncbi:methyltransferase domain-containing protein [Candidatus Micrarchaeota archaeon]|nr:methyltransferase domain-containing protein [Candidatus Micrarchaeota archaeon]